MGMNLQQKQIVKILRLTGITLALLVFIILFWGWQSYWRTEKMLQDSITPIFAEAVKEAVQLQVVNEPALQGVIISVPTKTSEKLINESELYVSQQYKLLMKRVDADTINAVFQHKLQTKNKAIRSIVSVSLGNDHSSVSGDTLNCVIRYRTPIIRQEIFNEIRYRGIVCYPSSVIFNQMPKGGLYLLSFVAALLMALLAYLLAKKYCIRADSIVRHRNGTWNIGYTLFNPALGELKHEDKSVTLPAQQLKILQWLLEDENHRIEKSFLQETFWANSLTGYNSMTSSINRLRTYLNEVDCHFTVATQKGSDWYVLEEKEQ